MSRSSPDAALSCALRSCAVRTRAALPCTALACAALSCAALACSDGDRDSTQLQAEEFGGHRLTVADATPIVFRADRSEASRGDLYAMSLDGSVVRALTADGDNYFPRWSPDGQSLAFRNSPSVLSSELGVMSADGSGLTLLTDGDSGFAPVPPSWSSDGRSIAFGALLDAELQVWIIGRWGGGARRLFPQLAGGQDSATWSWSQPSRIAFTGPLNADEDLWVADDPDGSSFVNVTEGRVFAPATPRWSPDGRRIAFSGYPRAADGTIEGLGGTDELQAPGSELFVIDVATRELSRLTDNLFDDRAPVWSPDGESLLFASDRDGDFDLWLLPVGDPELALNLIDDDANPRDEDTPDWYSGPRD